MRFGLLSEALQQARSKEGKPAEWKALERTNTERDYDKPYIVETQAHYHLNTDGGSIPIRLMPENTPRLYSSPEIDTQKSNPDGSERYKQLLSERPDYWLSPYELVNLTFYHHLCVEHDLPQNNFPRVDNLLKIYTSSLRRMYQSIQQHSVEWVFTSTEQLDSKLKEFCNSTNTYYTILSKDLPKDLLALLLRKVKPVEEIMLQQAKNTLELMVADGEDRLRDVQRVKQSLNDRMKPGKSGHRVLRAGEMATFLTKDMLRLLPVQDESKQNKGKPTSIMADLLQARLAYFGRDKTSLPALFSSLGLTGSDASKCHPFVGKINIQSNGMNGIAQFYEAYLIERKNHFASLQAQLTNIDTLRESSFAWLHLNQIPPRMQGKDQLHSLLKQLIDRKNEPLNLPRGLFRELIVRAMQQIARAMQQKARAMQHLEKKSQLTDALQIFLGNELIRSRFTSPSVLVALYMSHVVGDASQDFYFCDIPGLEEPINSIEADTWKDSDWAKRTKERLQKANPGLRGVAFDKKLIADRDAKCKKLRAKKFELDRALSHRATQDQVLFLAAKRLINLNDAPRRNRANQVDEAQVNPFEKIKLQTLKRSDLNLPVPHNQLITLKSDSGSDSIKAVSSTKCNFD